MRLTTSDALRRARGALAAIVADPDSSQSAVDIAKRALRETAFPTPDRTDPQKQHWMKEGVL